jgi:hypothetical protein
VCGVFPALQKGNIDDDEGNRDAARPTHHYPRPDIRDQLLGQYDPDSSVFVGRDPDWDAACEALEAKQVKPGPDDGIPDFLRRAPKAANGGAS